MPESFIHDVVLTRDWLF